MQVSRRLIALGAASAILIAACSGSSGTSAPTTGASQPAASAGASGGAINKDWKACVAFDTGGLGDKGFNDLAKKGLDDAAADLRPLALDLVHGGLQRGDHRRGSISPRRHRLDLPPDPLSLPVDGAEFLVGPDPGGRAASPRARRAPLVTVTG